MKWEYLAAHWNEYKLNAKRRWPRLSASDLDAIAGDRARLVARIAELYAIAGEQAEAELAAWLDALREVNPFQ
jgi:hypothetical protein